LLSLAAFGLLMGYYQNQMVQVLADTASDISRATLRALPLGEHEILLEGRSRNVFSWSNHGPAPAVTYEVTAETELGGGFEEGVVVTQIGDSDEVQQHVRRIERILTSSEHPPERIAVQRRLSGEGGFFIDFEDVHVRSDTPNGLVLTITTLTRPPRGRRNCWRAPGWGTPSELPPRWKTWRQWPPM